MENLTIQGSVMIDEERVYISLLRVLIQLISIDFEGSGYADYDFDFESMELSLYMDGPISQDTVNNVKEKLDKLRCFITQDSRIFIERERWEMNVTLWTATGNHNAAIRQALEASMDKRA